MKKITLLVCLLMTTLAAHAQFEKGKWFISPSVTGLDLAYDTGIDKASFALEANGGAFLIDNLALLVHAGASFNVSGSDTNVYTLGVGGRYYFDKIGIFTGAGVNLDHWSWSTTDDTRISLALEAGYAFFLSRTVTLEPAVFCNIGNEARFGLKLGFGFYF
ncbi:MAG: hypothetical protein LBM62_03360 [Mediterranea sp.]|jgi:hypothetical protein|nr:hypothetical protein [Mediterranea sp.]